MVVVLKRNSKIPITKAQINNAPRALNSRLRYRGTQNGRQLVFIIT